MSQPVQAANTPVSQITLRYFLVLLWQGKLNVEKVIDLIRSVAAHALTVGEVFDELENDMRRAA